MEAKKPELAQIGVDEMKVIRSGLRSAQQLLELLDTFFSTERNQHTVATLLGLKSLCRLKVDEAIEMTERARIIRDE